MSNGNRELEIALGSMNVLNAWAKNVSQCAPRRAIYWLKSNYAIWDAVMAGMLIGLRPIKAVMKCNRCKDGVYYDWNSNPKGRCYHCNGTGKATLLFVETVLSVGGQQMTWHHPLEYRSWPGWPMADLEPQEAENWAVNKPGIELDTDAAVAHLNVVEEHWMQWRKQSPYQLGRELGRGEWDSRRYYIFNYSLDVGYSPKGCVLCGGDHAVFCKATTAPGIEYSRSVCSACEKDPQLWSKLHNLPMPTLSSEVQRWRYRHALDFEQTWNRSWHDTWADRKVDGQTIRQ